MLGAAHPGGVHLLLLQSCGGSVCRRPDSSQGQSSASYLAGVMLQRGRLAQVLGEWWMVVGKLTLLEQMCFGGFIPILTCVLQAGTPAPSLLRDSYHKYDCLENNHTECFSAQLCLGGEKCTHHCQELGSDGPTAAPKSSKSRKLIRFQGSLAPGDPQHCSLGKCIALLREQQG